MLPSGLARSYQVSVVDEKQPSEENEKEIEYQKYNPNASDMIPLIKVYCVGFPHFIAT